MGQKKREKIRNHSTKDARYKKINKTAAIFDDDERKAYLTGLIGGKKKRKEEYVKKKIEKEKKYIREQKAQIRNEKKQQIEKLQEILDENNQMMKTMQTADKAMQKQEKIETQNKGQVKITTTFFK